MLIFDADGLIKLNRAGVLELVIQNYKSLVPAAVCGEIVVKGGLRGYDDSTEIALILEGSTVKAGPDIAEVDPEIGRSLMGLGAGETQTLHLALRVREHSIIISDDRRFLGVLSELSIPYLIPSHIILRLARDGLLSLPESIIALNRLRPFIRSSDYLEVFEELGE